MTPLALLVAFAVPGAQKTLILDDFTVTPWSWTLYNRQSKSHDWQGLDPKHCIFRERQAYVVIDYNPNNTSLTFSVGDHEQKFTSPLPLAWDYWIQYGNDGSTNIDLSAVDRFYLDMYAIGGSYLPDSMTLSVHDAAFHGGTIGWNGRQGGVYFDKKNFPSGIDWHHITYLGLEETFDSLPNPTTVSVTNFYATLRPVVVPSGARKYLEP